MKSQWEYKTLWSADPELHINHLAQSGWEPITSCTYLSSGESWTYTLLRRERVEDVKP